MWGWTIYDIAVFVGEKWWNIDNIMWLNLIVLLLSHILWVISHILYLVPITSSPLILRWVTNIILMHFFVLLFHICVSLAVDGIVSHVLKVHINDIIPLVLIPLVNIIPLVINKYYYSFGCCCRACGILVPWLGFKPVPSALKGQSLNHWTTGKVPC